MTSEAAPGGSYLLGRPQTLGRTTLSTAVSIGGIPAVWSAGLLCQAG